MRLALIVVVAATLAATPLVAQGTGGSSGSGSRGRAVAPANTGRERREAIRERMRTATPEERSAARDRMRDRRDALTPSQRDAMRNKSAEVARRPRGAPTAAQKEFAQSLREKRQALRADVATGKLDREAAAKELRAWVQQNRPKPSGG